MDVISKKRSFPAKKSLGQHFLKDAFLADTIAQAAGHSQAFSVLEVGPGPGQLTRSLLGHPLKHLFCVEKDKRFYLFLKNEFQEFSEKVTWIHQDALSFKIASLGLDDKIKIISNLPYNVGTQLLILWFQQLPCIDSITVLLQKEVVDRLKAPVGSRAYGRLSIIAQWLCDIESHFDVPPEAFSPAPKVMSTLVTLRPKGIYPTADAFEKLTDLTRFFFQMRRKTLGSILSKAQKKDFLTPFNIDPSKRPQNISVDQYVDMSRFW